MKVSIPMCSYSVMVCNIAPDVAHCLRMLQVHEGWATLAPAPEDGVHQLRDRQCHHHVDNEEEQVLEGIEGQSLVVSRLSMSPLKPLQN